MDQVIRRMKLDPAANNLDAARIGSIVTGIGRRIDEIWMMAWWPDLQRLEQRYFRDAWNGTTPYVAGDEVYDSTTDAYYVALSDNTNVAVSNAATWEVIEELNAYIAWEQTGKTIIGRPRNPSYSANPKTTKAFQVHRFTLSNDGIQYRGDEVGTSVWLDYQIRAPILSPNDYVNGTAYVVGDVIYYVATGDCYKCIQSNTGELPTSANYWERILIPAIFESYLVIAGYSEVLLDEGNVEASERADAKAMTERENVYERHIVTTGQAGSASVQTYG